MERHHLTILLFISFFLLPLPAFAAFTFDSETSRQAIASPRTKKFYKSNSAKQSLSLGGLYNNDQNSKEYQLTSRYFYQNDRQIHEFYFLQETKYADTGSGKKKRYKVKNSESYDASIASKLVLGESKNYGIFYHRTVYDAFSDYYYDNHTAIGLGRIFFNDKLEFDTSIGHHSSKNFPAVMTVIPSMRLNIKLGNNTTFIHRGYWFLDLKSVDNESKSSLVYRLSNKLSFELRYAFEQRRYEDPDNRIKVNQVSNSVTVGLIFDLQ